jgi:hypothetical protein
MAAVVREIERKYDPAAGGTHAPDAVKTMTGTAGIAAVSQQDEQLLDTVCYDTADLRLIGAGITLRRMRVIIPPTGNETISMLKTSSLASVITVTELLYAVQLIYSVNFQTIPLLIVASIWYLIVTSVLTVGQYYIERHYARGATRELPPTPWQRIRSQLFTIRSPLPEPSPQRPRGREH